MTEAQESGRSDATQDTGNSAAVKPDRGVDGVGAVMGRALRKRCPRCGDGALFVGWRETRDECEKCGLVFEPADGDTFGFLYLSAGFLTGVFLLVMFFFWRPATYTGYMIAVAVTVGAMIWTLPHRKAIAIGIDYLANRAWGDTDKGYRDPPGN